MSDSGSRPSNREIAYRLFAAECTDASYSYSESGEERAPNYVVTPTGARVNRLFAVGVLTEVSQAGDSILRARVADPTGAFVVYAGQYQPDAMAVLDSMEPPAFVAVTGKIRTFQPDDSDVVYTSIRPEEINEVDSDTRDRWTVSTAERTLERVATTAAALDTEQTGEELRTSLRESGIDPSLAAGIPIAIEQYGTTPAYLEDVQRIALDAIRLAAGEIDAVDSLSLAPDQGDGTIEPVIEADGIPIETRATETETKTADTSQQLRTPSENASETGEQPAGAETTPSASATTEPDQETEQQPPTAEEAATDHRDELTDERTAESPDTGGESDVGVDGETDIDIDTDTETDTDTSTSESSEAADEFDPEEFELDDEVRQEIESEYGTEFSTASEVDAPGEAGIETSESDVSEDVSESVASGDESDSGQAESDDSFDELSDESTIEEEPAADSTSTADTTEAEAEDTDIEAMLLDLMRDLDDGGGADRETLVDQVSEAADVSSEAVEDAIQDALMDGQCYEPDGGKLKPI